MKRSVDSHTDKERVCMIFRDKYKHRSAQVDSENNYLGNSKNLNNIINFIVGSNSKTNPANSSGQKAPKRDAPQKSVRKPSKPQKHSRNSLSSHHKKNPDPKFPLFQDKSLKTNPFNHYNRTPSPAQNLNPGIRPKNLDQDKFSAQKKTGNAIINRLDMIISGKENQIKNKPVKDTHRSRVEGRIDSKIFVDRHYGSSREKGLVGSLGRKVKGWERRLGLGNGEGEGSGKRGMSGGKSEGEGSWYGSKVLRKLDRSFEGVLEKYEAPSFKPEINENTKKIIKKNVNYRGVSVEDRLLKCGELKRVKIASMVKNSTKGLFKPKKFIPSFTKPKQCTKTPMPDENSNKKLCPKFDTPQSTKCQVREREKRFEF
jgi:hypothetical protein